MALTGLLPACRAAGELDERGQKKVAGGGRWASGGGGAFAARSRGACCLRASPLFKEIGFNTGSKQGVYARLWCARECHPTRYSEQLNFTRTRTTRAECAEELLELINSKHGDHLAAAERERTRSEAESAAAAGPSAAANAFAAMGAAQLVRPAIDLAAAAEQAAHRIPDPPPLFRQIGGRPNGTKYGVSGKAQKPTSTAMSLLGTGSCQSQHP